MVPIRGIKTERMLDLVASLGFDCGLFTRSMGGDWYSLPADEYRRRCEEALFATAQEFGAPGVAIRLGRGFPVGAVPALDLAIKTAPTLHDALARLQRYHPIWFPWTPKLRPEANRRVMHLELPPVDPKNLGAQYLNQVILAAVLETARKITSVCLRPRSVSFTHAAPRDTTELEEFFDAPLRFRAPYDSMEFDWDAMTLPLPGADAEVSEVVLEYLDALLERRTPEMLPIEDRVYRSILEHLEQGVPKMADVAKALGMSEPTLRRHLSRHQLSYANMVERARCHRAREMLANSQYSLTEIALSSGFSDSSAFARAFKRAHGETASDYRRRFARL
ncbi:MAG: virS1 [Deltaproteobacteria bacterium]|nr:virS1 [Deltaproteobacteria bacterium]